MNIVLLAATGRAGSTILNELVGRGHHVTAVARDTSKLPQPLPAGVTAVQDDLSDVEKLTKIVSGADAVVSAFGPTSSDPRYTTDVAYTDQLLTTTQRIIEAVRNAKVPRLIVVGGAGSLWFELPRVLWRQNDPRGKKDS